MVDQAGLNTWRVDTRAMVQSAGGQWRPLRDLLAMQDAATKYSEQHDTSVPVPVALPIVPPPPRAAPRASPVSEPVEPPAPAVPEPMAEEEPPIPAQPSDEPEVAPPSGALAEEPPAIAVSEPPPLEAWADADEPAIFTTGRDSSPALPPEEEEEATSALAEPTREDEVWHPEPSQWADAIEPSPTPAEPALQSFADDPGGGVSTHALQPPDDRHEAYARAADPAPAADESEPEDDYFYRRPRRIVIDERVLRAFNALGEILSASLSLLDRLYRPLQPKVRGLLVALRPKVRDLLAWRPKGRLLAWRPRLGEAFAKWSAARSSPKPSAPAEPRPSEVESPRIQSFADDVSNAREDDRWPTAVAGEDVPIIALKPADDDRKPLRAAQDFLRRLGSRASAWAVGVKDRLARLARRSRPGPKPLDAWNGEPATSRATFEPPRREPVKAPPAISELPVLRLAEIHEPDVEEDVYEGGGESLFPTAWLWTKRILWATALVGGGLLVVRSWEIWFPKAASLSSTAFNEANKFVESRELKERERRALEEGTAQLPHLSPDTIKLVMSRGSTGVSDPAEVFQAASDAADLGLSALTPAEREELTALRSTLLETLSPGERERLHEYDKVRGHRAPFAFEDQGTMELFARGVRAMPAESRERLQALLGRAVAAGLARSPETSPRP
jgi:hypothetical protein